VESANHVQRSACRCGPPPERCLAQDQELAQLGWANKPFRNQPRVDRELGLSVLRGPISVEAAVQYVLPEEPTPSQLKKGRIRLTTAGSLREAGFAVVHTPGQVRKDEHCSVVWPASDPLSAPQVPWPPEVSARFDSCFNEEREVQTDES
jgi:hypothetical protein